MASNCRVHVGRSVAGLILASLIVAFSAKPAPANGLDALSDAQSLFIDCSMHDRENRTVHENLMLLACRSVLHHGAMRQDWGPRAYHHSNFGWVWTLCPSRHHEFNLENLPDLSVRYWRKQGIGELQWISPRDAANEAVLGSFPECFWTSDA